MPYWEFLIQRETDRAWRPLTSRNLQVFAGNYRIIANTSLSNSAVQTQIFYQNDEQSPQVAQYHAQVISHEGLLVVLPFTHIQTGIWQLNCHVTTAQNSDIYEQLCLEVVPPPDSTETAAKNTVVPPAAKIDQFPDQPTMAVIHDHYPMVIDDIDPKQIIASSIANLDTLLTEIAPPPMKSPEQTPPSIAQRLIQSPEEDVLDLSTILIDKAAAEPDASATARPITTQQPAQLQAQKLTIVDDQMPTMFAVTDSEFSVLDTDSTEDLPINSYEVHSHEVVVED
jgi:hypothetical protein